MHRNTPNAIQADPYNRPRVNNLLVSNKNEVKIANNPNKNKITAAIILSASFKTSTLAMAKAIINAPPKSNSMERIIQVWFKDGRIFIKTDKENTYSRPLEAFPLLLEATPEQRAQYEIGMEGDDLRWEEIDEDIHISSFFEKAEPNSDNVIAKVFERFPQLNVSEVARTIGINKSLLSRYIYGIKKPSEKRTEQILQAIRQLGRDMASI